MTERTGRTCYKHLVPEWCPDGVCRWCEPDLDAVVEAAVGRVDVVYADGSTRPLREFAPLEFHPHELTVASGHIERIRKAFESMCSRQGTVKIDGPLIERAPVSTRPVCICVPGLPVMADCPRHDSLIAPFADARGVPPIKPTAVKAPLALPSGRVVRFLPNGRPREWTEAERDAVTEARYYGLLPPPSVFKLPAGPPVKPIPDVPLDQVEQAAVKQVEVVPVAPHVVCDTHVVRIQSGGGEYLWLPVHTLARDCNHWRPAVPSDFAAPPEGFFL